MEGTANQGAALDYVSITPTGYEETRAYPVIILVHGFGASMYDLAGLAPGINQTDYVYLCPNGIVPLDVGGGQVGFGWTTPGGFGDEAEGQRAEDAIDAFVSEVSEPFKLAPGKVLIIGFSQGGGLAYQYGLPRSDTFAGVAALSASLAEPDKMLPRLPDLKTQPVFIGHGNQDPVVPIERGQDASALLTSWGYGDLIYNEYNGAGHEITPQELRDLADWVARVLPTSEQPSEGPADTPPSYQSGSTTPGGIILP